jgi:hypothetical protein
MIELRKPTLSDSDGSASRAPAPPLAGAQNTFQSRFMSRQSIVDIGGRAGVESLHERRTIYAMQNPR